MSRKTRSGTSSATRLQRIGAGADRGHAVALVLQHAAQRRLGWRARRRRSGCARRPRYASTVARRTAPTGRSMTKRLPRGLVVLDADGAAVLGRDLAARSAARAPCRSPSSRSRAGRACRGPRSGMPGRCRSRRCAPGAASGRCSVSTATSPVPPTAPTALSTRFRHRPLDVVGVDLEERQIRRVAGGEREPGMGRRDTALATPSTSGRTSVGLGTKAGMRANRENSSTSRRRPSTSWMIVSVHSATSCCSSGLAPDQPAPQALGRELDGRERVLDLVGDPLGDLAPGGQPLGLQSSVRSSNTSTAPGVLAGRAAQRGGRRQERQSGRHCGAGAARPPALAARGRTRPLHEVDDLASLRARGTLLAAGGPTLAASARPNMRAAARLMVVTRPERSRARPRRW